MFDRVERLGCTTCLSAPVGNGGGLVLGHLVGLMRSRSRACRVGLVLCLKSLPHLRLLRRVLLVPHHILGLLKPLDHLLACNRFTIDICNDLGKRLEQTLIGCRSFTLRTGTAQHSAE